MNAREITECLVKITKLIKSEDYENALESTELLLASKGLSDYNRADAYNYKATCLLNLGRYDEALDSFNISYLLDNHLINNKVYDDVYNRVNGTDYLRAFNLVRINDFLNRKLSDRASFYFKKFAKENDIGHDELLELLGIDKTLIFNEKSDIPSKEEMGKRTSAIMIQANQCISKGEYKNAISILNQLPNYGPALKKKSNLLIEEVMMNPASIKDDYHGYLRNIGYLNEASKGNDESLLIKAYYLLEGGFFEKSLECYDNFLKNHENDKRALYGKIVVLNEMGNYDYALEIIESFSIKSLEYVKSEVLAMKGKSGTSIKVLNQLLKENKMDVNPIISKALIYLIDEKIDKALRECDKALEMSPKNVDALLLNAELLFGTHKYKKALKILKEIPNKNLPDGYRKLEDYIENRKGKNSGFYGVFKKDSYWEYVYVEFDIFKRLKASILEDLKSEVIKRGLIWKGVDRSLQMKSTSQNKIEKSLSIELLYDFDNNHNALKIQNVNENTIKMYDEALKSDPENHILLNNKGYALLKLERIDESIVCFDNALEINPIDYHVWFNKGFAFLEKGDYADARECFFKSFELKDFSDSFKDELSLYIFDLGWSLCESGKYVDSIECYNICIKINPKMSNYYNCMGISLDNIEEYDNAIEYYGKALKFEPYDEIILNNRKICLENKIIHLYNNEYYEECIAFCDECLKNDDFNVESDAWHYKAESLRKIDINNDKIEEYYKKGLQYCNDDSEKLLIYQSMVYFYMDRKNYQKALNYLDKLLENENDDFNWYLKGECLRFLENFEESLDCYDNAIRYSDNEYSYYYNCKAISLENLEKFDEALDFYVKALEIEPDNETVIDNKKFCFQSQIDYLVENDNYVGACEWCDIAISNFPNHANFYNCKAIILSYLNRFDEALEFYDKALEIDFDDVIIENKLGCIKDNAFNLYSNNDFEDCISWCDEFLKLNNEDYLVWDLKGDCLMELEMFEESILCFDNAINYCDGENSALYHDKAVSLQRIRRFDEALEYYDKAIKLEPDLNFIRTNKESCLKEKNDYLNSK